MDVEGVKGCTGGHSRHVFGPTCMDRPLGQKCVCCQWAVVRVAEAWCDASFVGVEGCAVLQSGSPAPASELRSNNSLCSVDSCLLILCLS